MCMVSCSAEKKAEDKGEALKAKIENCTNPDSLRVYVQEAKDYAAQLVKEGKDKAAESFLNEVTPAVQAKDPSAAAAFTGLSLEAKADSAIQAAKDAAKTAVDSTKAAVSDKVQQAKDAVSDKVSDAKDATKDAIDAAKTKTAEAAQTGADKVKEALGK